LVAAAKLAHREGFSLITPLASSHIRSGRHSWNEKHSNRNHTLDFIALNSHDDIKNGVLDIVLLGKEDNEDKCAHIPNMGIFLRPLYLAEEQARDMKNSSGERNDGRIMNVFSPRGNAWRETYPVMEVIDTNAKSVLRCWLPNLLNDGQKCWE